MKFAMLFVVASVFDIILHSFFSSPSVAILAEPVSLSLLALSTIYAGGRQLQESGQARDAQRALEDQRKAQLAQEATEKAAAAKRAETSGQRAGFSSRSDFLGGIGFGSGNTDVQGRGTLFGN